MCKAEDLLVLVVDADQNELSKTCGSLNNLGVTRLICVNTYMEAVEALATISDIDIVIADFAIEAGKALGLLLCTTFKKENPGISFILVSKEYSCSVAVQSLRTGTVDDILDISRSGEIENLMKKWVYLAQQRIITKEILNGKLKEL